MKNLLYVACLLAMISCSKPADKNSEVSVDSTPNLSYPELARDMTIYEVNIRQHTAEGTFKAFEKDLPRLKELGADILWIMPVQPIGQKLRKGTLGSYYSIRDYKSVNPEFGTMDDFKALVQSAHSSGFKVILDWVPNHTAWDHTWQTEHPEYYMTDSAAAVVGKQLKVDKDYYKKSGVGKIVYEADWADIALLNLYHPGTKAAMIDAMKFWITETDIDGFRADHAGHEIPLFFWEEATATLNPLKNLFWLAEWDEARMHIAFHSTYDWSLLHLTEDVAKGKATADDLHVHIAQDLSQYGKNAFRLNMIDNHDENSWKGTIRERYGDAEKAFAVFSFTAYGTPMLYSGQEAGLNKRLRFFEKDTVSWEDPGGYFPFYQKLNQIKANNPALWNGGFGAITEKLEDGNKSVFSFRRIKDDNTVVGVINMTAKEQTIKLNASNGAGTYTDAFTGKDQTVGEIKLSPWQYLILTKGSK
jgi:glycosidase